MRTKQQTTGIDPVDLSRDLERRRKVDAARRSDELARVRAQATHNRDRADVAVADRLAELQRAERESAAKARARLVRMYAEAREAGERTRIQSAMARSGEARALRLERLRALNLKVLVPVLLGFGAWSTTGVQQGAARLMGVDKGDVMWWVLWVLEPVLIAAVAWVIICRARLASVGGTLADRAVWTMGGCLGTSIMLNLIAAVPGEGGPAGWAVPGAMLAHAIGPVGAAATAHLIGVVDESVSDADPWTDERGRPVPLLSEMDLTLPEPESILSAPAAALESAPVESAPAIEAPLPVTVWPVPVDGRQVLPIIARTAVGEAPRTTAEQSEQGEAKAPAPTVQERPRTRPNKGVAVPAAARKSAAESRPKERSDKTLRAHLDWMISTGEIDAEPSVRAVQSALAIGFDRAKRVLALPAGDGHVNRVVSLYAADAAGGAR